MELGDPASTFSRTVALPLTAPIGRGFVDPDWAGTIAAAVVSFLLIYFGVRIFGSSLSRRAQAHPQLGGVDRFVGVFEASEAIVAGGVAGPMVVIFASLEGFISTMVPSGLISK